MTNDTTTDLPPSSQEQTPGERVGFDIDVTHEDNAAFLVLRVRIPHGALLRRVVDALTSRDPGFSRLGGPGADA